MHHPLLHRHALPRPHFCARRAPATIALHAARTTSRTPAPSSDAARPSTEVYLAKAVVHGDRTTASAAAAAARDAAVGITTPAALSTTTNVTKSMSQGDVVAGVVVAVNPVGAFVDLGGVTGLLHVSQISHEPFSAVDTVLAKGDSIKALVRFIDHSRGRIALSTKKLEPQPGDMLKDPKAVYERAEEMAERYRQERNKAVERKREDVARFAERFKEGDVVAGVVQSVGPYGALVDLRGVTGQLHVSKISHERVPSVEKVLAEGDNVKALVFSIDRDSGRIELSTKELEPVPGDMLKDAKAVYERAEETAEQLRQRAQRQASLARFKEGDVVAGVVQSLVSYGAFVDLGSGVTGLLHVSQISHERVASVDKVFAEGDRIKALVRFQELPSGTYKLTTKDLEPQPGDMLKDPQLVYGRAEEMAEQLRQRRDEDLAVKLAAKEKEAAKRQREAFAAFAERYKVHDVVGGVVQSVKPYGAFVDLGGVTGLLHVSQVSHERVTSVEKVLTEGDEVNALVLSIDRDRGRITLSTRHLEPQPGDMLKDPKAVYESAEEMAEWFRQRPEEALAARKGRGLKAAKRARKAVATFAERHKVGDVVAGVVQEVKPSGVIVDLGGVEGLLRPGEFSGSLPADIRAVFAEGDNIKATVLSLATDRDRGYVTLGIMHLEPQPGDMLKDPKAVYERAEEMAAQYSQRQRAAQMEQRLEATKRAREAVATFAERHKVGDVVAGVVVAVKTSKVIVDLGGVEGRLRAINISSSLPADVRAVFAEGDSIKALINSINPNSYIGRIELSTKELEPQPGDMLKNPKAVYERAEEMAERYREQRMQAEVAEAAEA